MTEKGLRRILRQVPDEALRVCSVLQAAEHDAYLVGGVVRDLLDGRKPGDIDIATSAVPDVVQSLFKRVVPTGVKHGTVTVLMRGRSFEVTTFRTEQTYSNHRHPDSVTFVGSIEKDLARRDFTFNGMAIDPSARTFMDPYHGESDLRDRVVRAIGAPEERFGEDALRMLRAVRFAAQLEATVEPKTLQAISRLSNRLEAVSSERVRDELVKILRSPLPSTALRLMRDTGVLDVTIPELAEGVGVEQRGVHAFDVFEHSIIACDAALPENLTVRLAALLHDIGKPRTLRVDADGNRTFHGHDRASAVMARELLRRLRFPNVITDDVVHLIRQHMYSYSSEWTDAAIRRFVARVGPSHLADLFDLREADSHAQTGSPPDLRGLRRLQERVQQSLDDEQALSRSDLKINGDDLAEVGIPRGPAMGTVIEHLFETVLDDPEQNERDQLLRIASRFYKSRIPEGDQSEP